VDLVAATGREPAKEDEQSLVSRAGRGEVDAFEALVCRYQARIYNYALRLLGQREEAEDVAQETFVRAWQHLSRFQGRAGFAAWLYRIAHNLCLDELRRPRRREAPLEARGEARQELEMTRGLELGEIRRAVEELPPIYRSALLLRFTEDRSFEEMAEILALPIPTVKSHVYRGIERLRRRLRRERDENES
jgi:RNA polymerase sigma-70 factor (ECF subfamily)